jgi:hypothetical protein
LVPGDIQIRYNWFDYMRGCFYSAIVIFYMFNKI